MIVQQPARQQAGGGSTGWAAADGFFSPVRFGIFLGLVLLATFPGVLFGQATFVFRDFGGFGYPLASFHRMSFWRGEVPLWDPLNDCGLPFLAQWNTMALYPFSLIYLLLPLPFSLNLFCLIHLYGAGIGMYFLARRWTGSSFAGAAAGIGYAINGLTLHALMWPNNIAGIAWIPWVVLATERAWSGSIVSVVTAGCAAAMQILTGAPEMIGCTWVVLLFLWGLEWHRNRSRRLELIGRFSGCFVIALGISAAQLLPFFDLLLHSDRGRDFGAQSWAMPAWGWLNLVVPAFRCYPSPAGVLFQPGQFWTSSYYPGIAMLVLGVAAPFVTRSPRTCCLGILALLGLILALGEKGIVYALLIKAVPALGWVRYPIKFVILPLFALPLLAAAWLGDFSRADAGKQRRWMAIASVIGMVALVAGGLTVWYSRVHPIPDERWALVWESALGRVFFLTASLAGIFFARRAIRERFAAGLLILLLTAFVCDVLNHAPRQNPTADPAVFEPGKAARQFRFSTEGPERIMLGRRTYTRLYGNLLPDVGEDYMARRLAFFANCNLLDEVPTPQGLFSLHLREFKRVQGILLAESDAPERSPLADFIAIGYVTDPVVLFEWRRRTNAMPMVTIGQKPEFLSESEIPARLADPNFDPRATVFLPEKVRGVVGAAHDPAARVRVESWRSGEIHLQTESAMPACVVLSQAFYHAWKGEVDGRETRIYPANYAFQTIEVPPGRHAVRLIYRDRSFQWGMAGSVLTIFLSGAMVAWDRRRAKRPVSGVRG